MADAELKPRMPVKVHYNLHKGGYSVTVGGRVVANVPDITLTDVRFMVQPAGLVRIRRTGRREVIARAAGVIEAVGTSPDTTGMRRVTFNPHRCDTFVTADDNQPIYTAPLVVFKGAYAFIPERGTE